VSSRRRPLARRRRGTAVLAGLAGLSGLSIALAAPASAHDELVSSSPAAGATVDAPSALTLTYSEALVGTGYRVVVRGPDGRVDGDASLSGTRLVNRFASPLPAGPYDVVWRVVSADGHPISGRLSFTVRRSASAPATTSPTPTASSTSSTTTAAPSTTPAPSTPPSTAPTDPLSSGSSGGGRLLTFGLIAAVLAAGAGALAAARRTRGGPGA
jgi:methionine-rich copper-binding protein CopC